MPRRGNSCIEKGGATMDVQVGDVLVMKKAHPCGSREWKVCGGCGHQVMLPRTKAEKSIKKILRGGVEV